MARSTAAIDRDCPSSSEAGEVAGEAAGAVPGAAAGADGDVEAVRPGIAKLPRNRNGTNLAEA
ncbi:hypothetical protein L3i22_079440 [Actinoplanes sp. L3-i22]|nr:hypothetical protein L3i22_079440 [Actinoplanes sp. L3-i22]